MRYKRRKQRKEARGEGKQKKQESTVREKQGRLPKSRVNGVLRVMKKDASDEKRCE